MAIRVQSLSLLLVIALVGSFASGAMGSVYSDTVIADTNPTIYWDFQDGSLADLAADGGNNTATLGTYPGITVYTGIPGPDSDYVGFSDTNQSLSHNGDKGVAAYFVDGLETSPGISTNAYSMSCWINSSTAFSSKAISYLFGRGDVTNPVGTNGPISAMRDSVGIWGTYNDGPGAGTLMVSDGTTTFNGTTILDASTWYNVTLVRDNADMTVYVNGQPELTATTAWQGTYGDIFAFGGRTDAINASFGISLNGKLDEAIVWNKALTPAEVATLYEAAPYVEPPVIDPNVDYAGYIKNENPDAYWRFQESAGAATAADEMGWHDLTLTSAATLGSTGPDQTLVPGLPAGNTAVQADGTGPIATVKNVMGGYEGYQLDYSTEMWVKLDSSLTSGSQCLLYRNDVDNPSVNLEVGDFLGVTVDETTGEKRIVMTNGMLDGNPDNRNSIIVGRTALEADQWYHVAMTRQNRMTSLYIDGRIDAYGFADPRSGYFLSDGTFTIGAAGDTTADLFDPFVGAIDELSINRKIYTSADYFNRFPVANPNEDYAGYIADRAVEASWRFQESAGSTTVVDQKGLNNLTLNASATLGVAGPIKSLVADLTGENTAVQNDGTAPIAVVQNVLGGTNGYLRDYSAEMWIKIDSSFTSGNQCLLYRNDLDNPEVNLEVGDFFGITMDDETGEIHLVMTNGMLDESAEGYDGRNIWLVGETALDTDTWYHVALSDKSNDVSFYLNGELDASGLVQARSGYFLSDGTWTIGGAGDTELDLFDPFVGAIDELTIYAGILSEEWFQERSYIDDSPAIAGDANGDGKVDGSDVTILAGNWQVGVDGTVEATWDMGDFNGDGKVDGSDVTILAGNWQYGVEAAAAAVPEPGTIVLLLTLAAGLFVWRRR